MRNKPVWILACMLIVCVATLAQQRSRDAVEVDPDYHHLVFENDHVRVFEARADAGATSPMHTHPPMLLVGVGSGSRIRFSMPDGSSQIVDFRPGQVMWVNGAEHSWKIIAGSAHVIGIEVKSAAAKPGR